MTDTHHGWAILYGDILDGVTQNDAVAEIARREGALVIPVSWDGDAVSWQGINQALLPTDEADA